MKVWHIIYRWKALELLYLACEVEIERRSLVEEKNAKEIPGGCMRLFRTAVKRTVEELITKRNRNSKAVAKGADFELAVGAVKGGMEIKDITRGTNFKEMIKSKTITMVIGTVHTRAVIREDPGDKLKDAGGTNILLSDKQK